jgi:hypothetical protein
MEIVLIIFLLLLVLALGGWVGFLEYRHRQLSNSFRLLMTGRGGADLEATLTDFVARMDQVERVAHSVDQRVNGIEVQLPYHVQHVGIVRFNPFSDKGGDQSFAIAILDDHADGVVISSMQSRTDNRVYGKSVIGGQSTYTLTNEEREAIARAMKPKA